MKKKSGIASFFRGLITVILTLAMLATFLSSALIYTLRKSYTSENLYRKLSSTDWAEVEVPYEDGQATLLDIVNVNLSFLTGEITKDNFNEIFSYFSIETVIMSSAEDFRNWLFDNGPLPTLDADEIADTILSKVDSDYLTYLSMITDVHELIREPVSRIVSTLDYADTLEQYEDYRFFLSIDFVYLTAAASAALFIVILMVNRMRFHKALSCAGVVSLISGIALAAIHPCAAAVLPAILARYGIPKSTFNIIYSVLASHTSLYGLILFCSGVGLLIIAGVWGALVKRKLRREHHAAD